MYSEKDVLNCGKRYLTCQVLYEHGKFILSLNTLKPHAVTELLAKGANPNFKGDDGASAVYLAVENYRKAPDIMLR